MENDCEQVTSLAHQELNRFLGEVLPEYKEKYRIKDVYFPWKRLFEIGFTVENK